jgi:hypothetical protein
MEKNNALVLVGVLLVGLFVGYVFGNKSIAETSVPQMPDGSEMPNDHSHNSMEDAMHDMTSSLEGKTGNDFDREFLVQMIVHHQGAVEMAEMVAQQTNRPELKQLAEGIITAQEGEIKMMQNWNNIWFASSSNTITVPSLPPVLPPSDAVACTMEAKMCPDGVTYVGRQGPNCEFSKCPGQ